jgi:hypothetical protein
MAKYPLPEIIEARVGGDLQRLSAASSGMSEGGG